MTRSNQALLFVLATTLCVLAIPLSGKGPTIKLTITGPDLPHSITVTSPHALVHVWAEDFMAGPAREPDPAFPRYRVSFHAQLPDASIKMAYVVYYVKGARTEEGFVYLPGRGEEGYALNVGTILRPGKKEGHWFHANDQWSRAIGSHLR